MRICCVCVYGIKLLTRRVLSSYIFSDVFAIQARKERHVGLMANLHFSIFAPALDHSEMHFAVEVISDPALCVHYVQLGRALLAHLQCSEAFRQTTSRLERFHLLLKLHNSKTEEKIVDQGQ